MVADGLFRKDLFYRLHVYPIRMPPLRERMEDLPLLAHELLARSAAAEGRQLEGFSAAAMELLCHHDWPGNVRELESVVTRAVLLATGPRIGPAELPAKLAKQTPVSALAADQEGRTFSDVTGEALGRAAVEYLSGLLRRHRGNVSSACVEAGLSREALHRLLRKHAVQAGDYRRRG
jgi:DNA-binding NtrC family response regulator